MTDPSATAAGSPDVVALERALREALDAKTKPPGSLGRLEALAVALGLAQGTIAPVAGPARIVVFAADHGVADEGVSAYPSDVTAQMVRNFVGGGAAVSVLGRHAGAELEVVDVGVAADLSALEGIVHDNVAPGTANLRVTAAMTRAQLDAALASGRRAVTRAVEAGVRTLALGEMGIANTTSAAVLTGLLCGGSAAVVTGRGTGVGEAALATKRAVVGEALTRLAGIADDPLECLREAGGLEIAALAGAMLEAPAHGIVIVVDGYIVTAAALVACRLRPETRRQLVFAHRSAETGHALALDTLEAEPLLDLDLRLGEGSGAVLALPLLGAACAVLAGMSTFADAGVSGSR